MATNNKTLVNTIQVKNLKSQICPLFVKPLAGSPIYKPEGGQANIQGFATLEAEDSRFDKAQLEQLRRNGIVDTTNLTRTITLTIIGGSGTIPADA